ncbi:hypothetical protein SBFV2_gp10 [Sulfolobales Beppu filamentous virus 2]|uniref:Uncharacterized protein n=1 Tax=Sulfolobales Beppu filamentous virus 2 TaxID=2493123 RepID=A0A3S8NET1_9VIRU|nr:hypothetical protein HOU84_gp10 [Sulfolobales Beppu filamentous virus 2]AZI75777.1 hypothetical protein SBFV2_gp10 [Sulfolobales Beppu filamentous virus 2]
MVACERWEREIKEILEKAEVSVKFKDNRLQFFIKPEIPKECLINVFVRSGYDVVLIEYLMVNRIPMYHIMYAKGDDRICDFYHYQEGSPYYGVYTCFNITSS